MTSSIISKILNKPVQSQYVVEPNVTGRDSQIIAEALALAIPLNLRYSLDHSNTLDMMRIFRAIGKNPILGSVKHYNEHCLAEIISQLQNGEKKEVAVAANSVGHPMQDLIDEYLQYPEIYMPNKGRL